MLIEKTREIAIFRQTEKKTPKRFNRDLIQTSAQSPSFYFLNSKKRADKTHDLREKFDKALVTLNN